MTISILNSDCRELEWSGADVLICDPPYRKHVHANATSQSAGRGTRHRDLGFEHLTPELRRWTCKLAASVNRWSVIFTDVESATWWRIGLQAAGATYIRTIPWIRWSSPQLSGDRPPTGCELLVVAYGKGKGRKHWNGLGNLTHLNHLCLRGEGKHKAQKPLDLMLDLVSWFSDVGELVVDPFSGSGTTGLASTILDRHFLGSELDEDWWAKSTLRLSSWPELQKIDKGRFFLWQMNHKEQQAKKAELAAHTAKVRAKLETKLDSV